MTGERARRRAAGGVGRLAVLRLPGFRPFYAGYCASLLGTSMSSVAVTFAVLGAGYGAADLGYVFAARIVPMVALMLTGGVLADRLGRRRVMLGADAGRMAVQASLAVALFTGRPAVWLFVVLSALAGAGDAAFVPALTGLTADVVPQHALSDANALLALAESASSVLGPALAGLLVAVAGPAPVVAADAGTFGASMLALSLLIVPARAGHGGSLLRDLRDGWRQFRSQTWLLVTTVQFALYNMFTRAPYLLLGPVLARDYLGGARAWGLILAASAAAAIVAGIALLGRRPRRLLTAAIAGTFCFPLPCLLLALHAPVSAVAAGAAAAGAGSAVFGTFWSTALQQRISPQALSRVTAISLTGAYSLGSAGFAVIGQLAARTGPGPLLGFGSAWSAASSIVVLALPPIRTVTWREEPCRLGLTS